MTDITMCTGIDCPLRENCHRAMANQDIYAQSYFMSPPYDNIIKDCEYYYPKTNLNLKQ